MNHAGQVIHPNSMGRANEHREAMCPSRPLCILRAFPPPSSLTDFFPLMGSWAPLEKKSSHTEPYTCTYV